LVLHLRNVPAHLHLQTRPAGWRLFSVVGHLVGHAPLLLGADQISFVDIDDTMKATSGYAKQGAGYGYNGVKGLNALLATAARGAARFRGQQPARRPHHPGVGRGDGRGDGLVVLRADSAFYAHDVVAAAGPAGVRFPITARRNRSVQAAIVTIEEQAWTQISYPNASWDDAEHR